MKELLLDAINGKELKRLDAFLNGISTDQLYSELRNLPVYLKIHNTDLGLQLREVTQFATL